MLDDKITQKLLQRMIGLLSVSGSLIDQLLLSGNLINIMLNLTHYFIIKIPNRREIDKTIYKHVSDNEKKKMLDASRSKGDQVKSHRSRKRSGYSDAGIYMIADNVRQVLGLGPGGSFCKGAGGKIL